MSAYPPPRDGTARSSPEFPWVAWSRTELELGGERSWMCAGSARRCKKSRRCGSCPAQDELVDFVVRGVPSGSFRRPTLVIRVEPNRVDALACSLRPRFCTTRGSGGGMPVAEVHRVRHRQDVGDAAAPERRGRTARAGFQQGTGLGGYRDGAVSPPMPAFTTDTCWPYAACRRRESS